jgi:hypothetical protein
MAGNQKKNPLVKEMEQVIDNLDGPLKRSFQNMHGGYPEATLVRFLKARDDNVPKASKMLIDCLNWRVTNDIDNVLAVQLHTLCQISVSFVGHFTSHHPLHLFC